MKIFRIFFVVLFFSLFIFSTANAVCSEAELAAGTCTETPTPSTSGIVTLDNPLGDIESPQALVGQVINSIFGIVGSLALVMFIYGGFLWLTSAGSADQVKKGKDIFIWAVIGLVVIFSAYSLVRFVIQGVGA